MSIMHYCNKAESKQAFLKYSSLKVYKLIDVAKIVFNEASRLHFRCPIVKFDNNNVYLYKMN